jgi:hypothetical protein
VRVANILGGLTDLRALLLCSSPMGVPGGVRGSFDQAKNECGLADLLVDLAVCTPSAAYLSQRSLGDHALAGV